MNPVNELQHEVLAEALKIGIGSASKSLKRFCVSGIDLSVPMAEFVERKNIDVTLSKRYSKNAVGVCQDFSGVIDGSAALIFPNHQSLKLAINCKGDEHNGITDERQKLLLVGNRIINASLTSITNLVEQQLHSEPPGFYAGDWEKLIQRPQHHSDSILIASVHFELVDHKPGGNLLLLIDFSSTDKLISLLDQYIHKVYPMAVGSDHDM